jgi:hypothetical protein
VAEAVACRTSATWNAALAALAISKAGVPLSLTQPPTHSLRLRYLNPGDSLPIGATASDAAPTALPKGWLDQYAGAVQVAPGTGAGEPTVVGVLPGPHANPDYFTDDAMDVFYSSPYEVHYNSNRWGEQGADHKRPCACGGLLLPATAQS